MENSRGSSSFFVTRGFERILPVEWLYAALKTIARIRAVRRGASKNLPAETHLPSFLKRTGSVRFNGTDPVNLYLNCKVELFPDRLSGAKWMKRCRFEGLDRVLLAVKSGRPLVLAFCHFGPYQLMGFWMRAAGIPVATIVAGEEAKRSRLNWLKARRSPFPEQPTVFQQDKLPEAIKFLKSGKPLLVALDTPIGKQLEVPFGDGWTFQMANGALRLAVRHQAELIFCSIIEEGAWRFRVEFGQPVPKKYLADETDLVPAAKHLLDEMLVQFEKHPEQYLEKKLKRFQPSSPAKTPEKSVNEIHHAHQIAAR